eukprot:m.55729 g.55729  ORF g.55729 m.55729 type:complete len:343 (-) comp13338_c0_seq2:312-1340(-)
MLLQIAFATLLLVNVASAGTWNNWGSWSATCGDVVRTRTCTSAPCAGNGTETNALNACSPGARITACGSSTPVYSLSPDHDNCGNLRCSPALSSPPAVVNGMPCRCFSRCYGGQCIPTECFRQNILDPNGVVDACGVCNGDNSTCTRTVTEAPEGSIVMNAAISVTFYFTWPTTDSYFVILNGATVAFSTESTTQSQWEAANGEFSFTVSGHTSIVAYSGPIAAEACGTRGFVKITNPQSGYNFILVNPHSSTGTPLTAVEITAYTTSTTTTTTTTSTTGKRSTTTTTPPTTTTAKPGDPRIYSDDDGNLFFDAAPGREVYIDGASFSDFADRLRRLEESLP